MGRVPPTCRDDFPENQGTRELGLVQGGGRHLAYHELAEGRPGLRYAPRGLGV